MEKEVGKIDDDADGARWYDEVRDDMINILYKRIGDWLTRGNS